MKDKLYIDNPKSFNCENCNSSFNLYLTSEGYYLECPICKIGRSLNNLDNKSDVTYLCTIQKIKCPKCKKNRLDIFQDSDGFYVDCFRINASEISCLSRNHRFHNIKEAAENYLNSLI